MSTSAPPVPADPFSDPVSGAYVHVADMADEADRERLVADVLDRFGRVDVLVDVASMLATWGRLR